jgi:hypothetical protein
VGENRRRERMLSILWKNKERKPMTPDEVVKELQKRLNTQEILNKPDKDLVLLYKSTLSLIQDYQKLREKIEDKDNRLWAIIRCNACNGTTDCENSPECPENYDGCIADDILKEMQTYLQQPTEPIER